MGTWSCDQKVCASCCYYNVRREIDFTGSFFDMEEEYGRGCK